MSVLDLNALNALPKVERILALAETNAQLESWTPKGVWRGRWKTCRETMCFRRALAFRRRSVCIW